MAMKSTVPDDTNSAGKAPRYSSNLNHFLRINSAPDLLFALGLLTISALLLVTFVLRLPAIVQSRQTEKDEKEMCAPRLGGIAKFPGEDKKRAFFAGPVKGCSDFLDPDVWLEVPRVYQLENGSIVRIQGDNVEVVFSHGYWADLVHGFRLVIVLLAFIAIIIAAIPKIRKYRRRTS